MEVGVREITIKITEQLWDDLKRGAKSRDMTISQFAAFRLTLDRYDLITEELIKEGHVSMGRATNETVL